MEDSIVSHSPDATPQHTPGPWRADGAEIFAADGTWIGETLDIDAPDDGRANAILAAAAPDLLAAANRFAQVWNDALAGWGPLHFSSDLFDQLGAAIAKAEGRNQ